MTPLLLIVGLMVLVGIAGFAWLYLLGVSLDAIERRQVLRKIRRRERKVRICDPVGWLFMLGKRNDN